MKFSGWFAPVPLSFLLIAFAPVDSEAQRIAFVTSAMGNGNLSTWPDAVTAGASGIDAGDAICRKRAELAGLANPQNFVAWLSDANSDAYCRL